MNLGEELDHDPAPAGNAFKYVLIGILLVIGLAAAYLLVGREDREKQRTAVEQMEYELDNQRSLMNLHREKLVELSRELDNLKQSIETGQVLNAKQSAQDYQRYANEQRAARDEYLQMEAQYNDKVVALQKLKGE